MWCCSVTPSLFKEGKKKKKKKNKVRERCCCCSSSSWISMAALFFCDNRRLLLDPHDKLYFPYEAGKQVTSAVRIKNITHYHIAYKFQTTSPKNCFMRPPSGILSPGDSIVASIVMFIEKTEQTLVKKISEKLKIVSLKVKEGIKLTPDLFREQRKHVVVEQVLRVRFLDPNQHSPELERLKRRVAEAEAAQERAKKKTTEEEKPKHISVPVLREDMNALERWNRLKSARKNAAREQK